MNPERYRRLQELFHEVMGLEGEAREACLRRGCADDPELRRAAERLLAKHDVAGTHALVPERFGAALQSEEASGPSLPFHGRVGGYRILHKIAEGGMGVVYLAEQEQPHRQVALKLMRPGPLSTDMLRRFQAEAELLGRLQHPGIAQIHEAGEAETEAGPQPYFAMEYVDGLELRRYAEQKGLGTRARVELLARVCDAVSHAHQKGIVHRDLKPGNVLVTRAASTGAGASHGEFAMLGQPKVLDFGVSRLIEESPGDHTRLTRTGHLIGTPAYMSPEQAAGDRTVDARCDVFALGVIAFELLAGRLPRELDSLPMMQALRVVQEVPAPRLEGARPDLRGDLSIILGKALELERGRRYASASALADDLRRYLADQPITARPPTLHYQIGRFVRRNRILVGSATLALLCLLVGLILALAARNEEARQRSLAELEREQAQRSTYSAQLRAAMAYSISGERESARQELAGTDPALRGWEWRLLSSSLTDELYHLPLRVLRRPVSTSTAGESQALFGVKGEALRLFDFLSRTWTDHAFPGRSFERSAVALVPCTRSVLHGDEHGRLELLDLDGERPPRQVADLEHAIHSIYLSRDGRRAAVVCKPLPEREEARGLLVLDVEQQHLRLELHADDFLRDVDFSRDLSRVAAASRDGQVHVWDATSGEPLHALRGHLGEAYRVAFSPTGRLLASAGIDRRILVWSLESGSVLQVLGPVDQPATRIVFHPDDAALISGHEGARIRHWDLASGSCDFLTAGEVASTAEASAIRQLLFGDQQDLVYAVGYEGVYVRPLRSPTPGILRHEAGQYPFVYGVDFEPSGRHLASAGWDGRVRIWDVATERQIAVLDCPPNAVWVAYSPDGRRILAFSQLGYGTHRLTSWDAVSLRQQGAREVLTISPSACFLPARGDVLVGSGSWEVGESALQVLDPTSLEVRGQLETRAPVWCMALSPDGVRVAYGMNDGNLALLDAGSLELLRTFGAHEGGVRSIAWSPDGRQLATGGRNGAIEIRDAQTARLLQRMESGGGELFALRFTPDGARILAGSRRHAIGVWDPGTGLEVVSLHGHESYVHDLALSPDGRVLASASGDNTVRLWDARPLEERLEARLEARDRMLAAERSLRERVLRSVDELGSVDAAARALADDPTLGELERAGAWNALQLSQAGERRTSVQ